MKEMEKAIFTLINDHATIKEAFIIDELQSYMDLSNPSKPLWTTPVRLRLKELNEHKQKVKEVYNKFYKMTTKYHDILDEAHEYFIKELGLEEDG